MLKNSFLRRRLALCLFCCAILVSVVSLSRTFRFPFRSFVQDLTPRYAAVMFHTTVECFLPTCWKILSLFLTVWHMHLFLPGGVHFDFLSDKLKLEAAVGHTLRQRFIKLSIRMYDMNAFESDSNRAIESFRSVLGPPPWD